MSSTGISLIVFACVFGGALLGIFLHAVLPQHHLAPDSKDIVKLGVGLVGTMAALLGWRWLGPPYQAIFFDPVILGILIGVGAFFLLATSLLMRILRGPPDLHVP